MAGLRDYEVIYSHSPSMIIDQSWSVAVLLNPLCCMLNRLGYYSQ